MIGIDFRHGGSGAGAVGQHREVPDRGLHDLEDLTLKGRDLFGYMRLVPGVIDTAASRDVTSHGAISGININGATSALNFTVDGVTDMDTGSNSSLQL